jgi:hypothetical protein
MVENGPQISEEGLDDLEEEVVSTLKEGSARATDQAESKIKEAITNVVESERE